MKAIKGLPKNLNFIFTGWGENRKDAISLSKKYQIKDNIDFLDFLISKPLLKQFYDMTDVMVDQFHIGLFGTSTVEALAGGVPVLTFSYEGDFKKFKISPPPVINCKNCNEIINSINKINHNPKYLDELTKKIQNWYDKSHNPKIVTDLMKKIIEKV